MDDLAQLIFFALLILFGLLSGGRKKRRHAARQRRQVPRSPPPAEDRGGRDVRAQPPERIRGDLLDEFLEALKGTDASEREPRTPEVPAEFDDIRPLETVEASGEESHRQFHERYVEPSAPVVPRPYDLPVPAVSRFRLGHRSLKDAIVMAEILGPPKALGAGDRHTGTYWSAPPE